MNTFGNKFRVNIFGESHGHTVGIVMDGVKPGVWLSPEDFDEDLSRRKSGAPGTSPRIEADKAQILSGVLNGRTTGAPLTVIFNNDNILSSDYQQFVSHPRPGHADRVAEIKWQGFEDLRGGGHFSGRLTLPIVAAGVVAKKMLDGVSIGAKPVEIGGCGNLLKWNELIEKARAEGDSLGGIIECVVLDFPAGKGEPFFDSVESLLSHAMFSIPGVRGIEFGDGFASARMKGSQHNDPWGPDGKPSKNGAGGINGGITNGAPIYFKLAFKPTSSISKPQTTFNFETDRMEELSIPGRHDTCFALRTAVIVEAMTAIVLAGL